jgi:hypothetical protein
MAAPLSSEQITGTRKRVVILNDAGQIARKEQPMAAGTAKSVFVMSCLLGLIVIAIGAGLEIWRQKRGESLLRAGQFRLRIFSSIIWMIALGSLAYAVAFLWPNPDLALVTRRAQAEKFLSIISGAMMLLLIGIVLLGYDMWQLARERRLKEAQFNLQLLDMAREEIEKAKSGPAAPNELKGDLKDERKVDGAL